MNSLELDNYYLADYYELYISPLVKMIKGDTLAFLILASMLIYVYFFDTPHVRGFWCQDSSIGYPYQPVTVTLWQILLVTTVIPGGVISFTEWRLCQMVNRSDNNPCHVMINSWLKKFYFTGLINLSCTIFFKFITGRLRPHFIDLCQPDVVCSNTTLGDNHPDHFYQTYNCLNPNRRQVNQGRQSFYSGHASISLCAAVYLILYIQKKYPSRALIKFTIQFVILLVGFYPGVYHVMSYHLTTDSSDLLCNRYYSRE